MLKFPTSLGIAAFILKKTTKICYNSNASKINTTHEKLEVPLLVDY
jgi:hypothetical protein